MMSLVRRCTIAISLAFAACLPADENVIPAGAIFATVLAGPDGLSANTIMTDDGWGVTVERILTSLTMAFTPASDYKESQTGCYPRDVRSALVDLQFGHTLETRGIEARKCRVWVMPASDIDELGAGVSEEDAAPFRKIPLPSSGPYDDRSRSYEVPPQFRIMGVARRGGITKRIDLFISASFYFRTGKNEPHLPVTLKPADRVDLDFTFAINQLFRTYLAKDAGELRFDAWAYADDQGDADGVITREDVKKIDLIAAKDDLGYAYDSSGSEYGSVGAFESYLAAQVALAWRGSVRGL